MNQTLEEILNVEAAAGPFAPGDAVLEQTLRDFIQLQSNTIAIATDLVGVRSDALAIIHMVHWRCRNFLVPT